MAHVKSNIVGAHLFKAVVSFTFIMLLSACSAGEAENTVTLTATNDSGDSFTELTQGQRATFIATVLHAGSDDPVSGAEVDFDISTGLLSKNTTYTNNNGQAIVIYDSAIATIGVNIVTVTYVEGDQVHSVTFSFSVQS